MAIKHEGYPGPETSNFVREIHEGHSELQACNVNSNETRTLHDIITFLKAKEEDRCYAIEKENKASVLEYSNIKEKDLSADNDTQAISLNFIRKRSFE